jgi:hypothetical protein
MVPQLSKVQLSGTWCPVSGTGSTEYFLSTPPDWASLKQGNTIFFTEGDSLNIKHISDLFKIGKLLLQALGTESRGRSSIDPEG